MKITFHLEWTKGSHKLNFKDPSAQDLYEKYTERLAKFTGVQTVGGILQSINADGRSQKDGREVLWICERASSQAKILSSEELAQALRKVLDGGATQLRVLIGGPDGVNAKRLTELKPQLMWSFGKLTLPHELATVVAAEQVYRAYTILKGHPYHSGH